MKTTFDIFGIKKGKNVIKYRCTYLFHFKKVFADTNEKPAKMQQSNLNSSTAHVAT